MFVYCWLRERSGHILWSIYAEIQVLQKSSCTFSCDSTVVVNSNWMFTCTGRDWWVTEPRILCSKTVSYPQLTVWTGCRSAPEVEWLASAPESNQSQTTVRATSGGESDLLFRLSKAVDLGDRGVDNDSPLHPFHTNLCRSPWMFFLVRTGFGWCLQDFQLCICTSVFRAIIDLGVM